MPITIPQSKLNEMHAKSNSQVLKDVSHTNAAFITRTRKTKFIDGAFKDYVVIEQFFDGSSEPGVIQQYIPGE